MKPIYRLLGAAALGLSLSSGALADEVLFENVRVINATEDASWPGADVLVVDDRIEAIAEHIEPSDATRVVDGQGHVMTAGFFNAQTQIGAVEIGAVSGTNDTASANARITASFNVSDAFNPATALIPYNRMHGITHGLLVPTTNVSFLAGTASVIGLGQQSIEVPKAAMTVTLGEAGSARSGSSRATTWALLEEALEDARHYRSNRAAYSSGQLRDHALSRRDLAALVPVVNGEMPLLVEVDRASDIRSVLAMAKSQRVSVILSGAAEGWLIAKEIAEAKVPVIIDPIRNLPTSYEAIGSRLDNAQLLNEAGVTLLFNGMGWHGTHNAYLVRQSAGNAIANGLPYHVAVAAVTRNPAKVFGLKGVGEIKAGAKATIVLWDGDPFEVTTLVKQVMINGVDYPLISRATRLRDRYFEKWSTRQGQ